ncbi:bifunctional phosphoglucose/phosphomannose isomerase [bacterium]|nr:MAG: bifunctional phosphoglucose/phosphomannose isomerase [bacterium]
MAADLNSRDSMKALDPKGMLELIEGFPAQCREALAIGMSAEVSDLEARPGVVALSGMGGSAAGGDFVRALFEEHGSSPFVVIRDYSLPNYFGVGDLVFIASYSGNTEETLSVYDAAKHSGARIIVVTSGGEAERRATEDGYLVVKVPGGQPPRASLGYMLMPVIALCQKMKLIPEQDFAAAFERLDEVSAEYGVDAVDNDAKKLAGEMLGKVGVCYGLGTYKGYIANRWRCQFNENAKYLLFNNAFPELCHNEIMGWVAAEKQAPAYAGIILQDGTESENMKVRADVTAKVIGGEKAHFHRVNARGESLLERMLSLTFIGDWVSIYLARLNEVDPTEIENIDTLKTELGKLGK